MNGIVKHFNTAGYGHIEGEDGHEYYVHYTSVKVKPPVLKQGQIVQFTPDLTQKMACAEEVRVIG